LLAHEASDAWSRRRFNLYFKNSVIISTIDALVMIPVAAMAAYALPFIQFPDRRLLITHFALGLIVPATAIILPLYVTIADLGLVNTRLRVILADVALALPVFILLLLSFLLGLPRDLRDAARVDGAREFRIFWSVMLPLARPAVIMVTLLEFLWSWNDLLLRLVFLTNDSLRTLTVGLLFFQGQQTRNVAGITAAAVIMAVPIVILFLISQRQFIQGLTKGALK
jgi:raffinose/stachyose/melibiose transport system permease protein